MDIFLGEPPANVKQFIIEHYGQQPAPVQRATTIITTQEDGAQEFLIEGTINRQWMIDNGFFNDNEYEWIKTITSVNIGTGSQEHPLTSIGDYAFQWCNGINSITIGNNVESIGSQAFHYCTGLTSATIPNSVIDIGFEAFCNCSDINNIIIGNSVSTIERGTFDGCSELTSITFLGKTLQQVQSINDKYDDNWYPWGISDTSIIHAELS